MKCQDGGNKGCCQKDLGNVNFGIGVSDLIRGQGVVIGLTPNGESYECGVLPSSKLRENVSRRTRSAVEVCGSDDAARVVFGTGSKPQSKRQMSSNGRCLGG